MGVFNKYGKSYDDGKKLMEEGNFHLAIGEFDKCMETHGQDSYIIQLKAFCLMQLEEYNQAIGCYEIILDDYNYDLDRMALNNIGIAYNKINKPDTAIEYFDEGIKYYPDYIDFWINKGVSLIELEKYEEALECYEGALNLDFSNKVANEGYNFLCEKLGIEGKDFFDSKKLFANKNHDIIAGLSAASYEEGKVNISEYRDEEVEDNILLDVVSEDDLDKLHLDFENVVSEEDLSKESDEETNHLVEGFIFCQSCGTKLQEDDIFCFNCGAKLDLNIFCKNCGTKLKIGDVFCKNCGTKLE